MIRNNNETRYVKLAKIDTFEGWFDDPTLYCVYNVYRLSYEETTVWNLKHASVLPPPHALRFSHGFA